MKTPLSGSLDNLLNGVAIYKGGFFCVKKRDLQSNTVHLNHTSFSEKNLTQTGICFLYLLTNDP